MEMDMMPLYNNSCGKVFKDKVILASPYRESHIQIDTIKRLQFVTRISLRSLLWVFVSSSFILLLYLERNLGGWLYLIMFFITLIFAGMSLVTVKRNYHILLLLNDGSKKRIVVSKDNKKEARKFVAVAMKEQEA